MLDRVQLLAVIHHKIANSVIHGIGNVLRAHVIEVAGKLRDLVAVVFRLAQHGADAVGARKILLAHAVADGGNAHGGHCAETGREMGQQRSASGGAELPAHLPAIDGHAARARAQAECRGRSAPRRSRHERGRL